MFKRSEQKSEQQPQQPQQPEQRSERKVEEIAVKISSDQEAAERCKSEVPLVELNKLLAELNPDHKAVDPEQWDWPQFWEKLGLQPELPAPEAKIKVSTAVAVLRLLGGIANRIVNLITSSKAARSEFTQRVVADLWREDQNFNYVICHTRHAANFQGAPGNDFSHSTTTFPAWLGIGSIRYDVYAFRSGSFTLLGDGGFLNWAFIGRVVSDTGGRQPRTVVFR